MDGEGRLPLLDAAAGQGVGVGGLGLAQGAHAQDPVVEDLGVAQGDRPPGRPAHADAQTAGDVLAEVDEDPLGGQLRLAPAQGQDPPLLDAHLDGPEGLHGAHGGVGGHDQALGVGGADLDRQPGGVVEAGARPPGGGPAGVDLLAVVQVGEQDLADAGPPVRVRGDEAAAAVVVGDLELDDGGDVLAVEVAVAAVEADVTAVPAVGELGAQRVRAGAVAGGGQQVGDVVGPGDQPLAVDGPPGHELVGADAPPVDLGADEAVGADVGAGGDDGAGQVELGAHARRAAVGQRVLRPGRAHGQGPPVGRVQEPDLVGDGLGPAGVGGGGGGGGVGLGGGAGGVGVGAGSETLRAVLKPMRAFARIVVHASGVGSAMQSTPRRSLVAGRSIFTMRRLSNKTGASPSSAEMVKRTFVPSFATVKVTGTRWKELGSLLVRCF